MTLLFLIQLLILSPLSYLSVNYLYILCLLVAPFFMYSFFYVADQNKNFLSALEKSFSVVAGGEYITHLKILVVGWLFFVLGIAFFILPFRITLHFSPFHFAMQLFTRAYLQVSQEFEGNTTNIN